MRPNRVKLLTISCLLPFFLAGCGDSGSRKYSDEDLRNIQRADAHNQLNALEKGYTQMADKYQKSGLIDQKTASDIKADIKRQVDNGRTRINRY